MPVTTTKNTKNTKKCRAGLVTKLHFVTQLLLKLYFLPPRFDHPAHEDGTAAFAKYNFADKCVPKYNLGTSLKPI